MTTYVDSRNCIFKADSDKDVVYYLLKQQYEQQTCNAFMRDFSYRATILGQDIRHDTVENFVFDIKHYGYIKEKITKK